MDNQQGNSLLLMDKYVESVGYSIGAITGDGTVNVVVLRRKNGITSQYHVAISNMDIDCVERVCYEINSLFDKAYRIVEYFNENGTKMYRLAISKRVIYDFFNYFVRDKSFIPDEVFKASREAKLDYIAGLFDTDGYISEHKSVNSRFGVAWRIGFASRKRTFVEDLVRLLHKVGVKVGKIYEQVSGHGTTMFVIKPNIRSFADSGCYFQIPRKSKRLRNYLEAMKPSETIMPGPRRLGQDIVQHQVKV